VLRDVSELAAEFVVYDDQDNLLFTSANQYDHEVYALHRPGTYLSTCWIPGNLMTEGTFCVRISIEQIQVPVKVHIYESDILAFQIVDAMEGDSARGCIAHNYPGMIRPRLQWRTRFLGEDISGDSILFSGN
jgi:lipopolysaccharide transport system ATP-binding protein